MLSTRASSARKDRLSIDILPELSIDTTFQCPHLDDTLGSDCGTGSVVSEAIAGFEQQRVEDAVFGEVAEWLSLNERDDYWPTPRRQLQNTGSSLRTRRQLSTGSLRTRSTSFMASDVPEPILYFTALQLLASCYTCQPASSANNLPIFRQRRESALITALRLQSQYRFAPAAGHNARPPSEASPWPGLYNGPSIEEELAELVSEQRMRERTRSGPCKDSPATTVVHGQVKTSGWNDGPAYDGERRKSNASDDSSNATQQGPFSRLLCLPAPKGAKYSPTHNRLHKEPEGPRPQLQPRRSSPSNTDSQKNPLWHRTSRSLKKIPPALRLRRAQSSPRRASTSPIPSREALDNRRNSSTPTLAVAKTFPYPIPEIRRISASTQGYSQSSAPFARPTDLMTAHEYVDETRLNPFFASIPNGLLRASTTPLDAISPFTSTETLHPQPNRQVSGYFDHSHTQERDFVIEGSGNSDSHGDEESRNLARADSEAESEDSIDALDARGKRENVLSRKRSISPELIERLRRSGSPSSEGSGSTQKQNM
ncbi:hypothetical protein BDV96DRAFT_599744 [Lophiotrema nucula]|uniref:Uncharacterized protein n=1 Tax=Lophiotrema nucula TaxID=690887 RepID=A0A6A5Z7D9_9PLEO|nr:hypothetical protein BDV96DRAFT_599744 [Lophiotrema nucula]